MGTPTGVSSAAGSAGITASAQPAMRTLAPNPDVFLEVAARRRDRMRQRQVERERERERERGRNGGAERASDEARGGEGAVVTSLVNLGAMFARAGESGIEQEGLGSLEGREYSYEEMRLTDLGLDDGVEQMDQGAEVGMTEDIDMNSAALDGDVGEKPEGASSSGAGGMVWAER